MQLFVDHVKFNRADTIVFALILQMLSGVVEPHVWDAVLKYTDILIPQLTSEHGYSKSVSFPLWTRSNVEQPVVLQIGNSSSLKASGFDSSKPTLVVSHGFVNTAHSPAVQSIKNAALQNYDVNVIGVNWGHFAMDLKYPSAASRVLGVGKHVSKFVLFLINEGGLSPKKVHLIGHSLGAHVSGFAGKELSIKGSRVGRISGLDPAKPGFRAAPEHDRLSSEDADFVDCIITSSTTYGFDRPICQANFFVNGGFYQPTCFALDIMLGVCSHQLANDYFAESVNATHIFEGSNCTNSGKTQGNHRCQLARMGYHADPATRGTFYVKTRPFSPYALEIKGERQRRFPSILSKLTHRASLRNIVSAKLLHLTN